MDTVYYNPAHSSGFSGAESLFQVLKHDHKRDVVEEWLKKQDAYTVHKPTRRKFPRNKYIVSNINELWQVDLCDMRTLREHNDDNGFILTVIDVFSKKAWAETVKFKTAKNIIAAFSKIFSEYNDKPLSIQSDKGKEFVASSVQTFFKEHDINFYTTNNPDVKAAVIERFNRTLKTRMWRYFTFSSTYRYIDILQDLITSYNNRYHRSIKMAPNEVNNGNILQVWHNLYEKGLGEQRLPKYNVGQHVRVSRTKQVFEKGYTTNWSEEVFKIVEVIKRRPPVYRIADLLDELIEGTFYEDELQPVTIDRDTIFKIDEVLEEKGRGRNKQYLVKWAGYDSKFNSWISAAQLQKA